MDLQLDTAGDLVIANYDVVLLEGVESIAQHLRIRLKFFLEEWFLDKRVGVPYYQQLLGAKPNSNAVRAIFRKAVLSTPGVAELTDFKVDFDGSIRTLSVVFRATTDSGETLVFDEEFIIF